MAFTIMLLGDSMLLTLRSDTKINILNPNLDVKMFVKGLVKKYRGGGGVVGRSREGVGHEVLSLVQGVGCAIFSYPWGVGHPILLHR